MKEIPLSQGKVALVDDEDFERLNEFKWYASTSKGGTFYSERRPVGNIRSHIFMHREIMNTPIGMETDHIDGNGLNNQKTNLRIVTRRQNLQNQVKRKNKRSKYPGVDWQYSTGSWRARIVISRKSKHLGTFTNEEDAFHAYMNAVNELDGK